MASMLGPGSSTANIYVPEEWSEAANSIAYDSVTSPPPFSFICGAKNSGKTTFSRHLLNILLQRYGKVAYLDTDVGQPEFTVPGFVSLTVVDKITPEEYCMFDKSENAGRIELPLIVNTPGWVKGIGYEILVDMLRYICPTHVVKINISAESKNLPGGAFWLDGDCDGMVNIIEIKSAQQDNFNRSVLVQKDASLLRDLRIMAYFRQCFPSDKPITTIKELAHAVASHPPYEVPISIIKIRHLHCQVPSTETYYSLNATIVGLAVSSEESEDLPWCVGLGIVRGIDTFKGVLYVITPVPASTLEKVNLFLQGFIQIPTCLLQ
ncbi:hypothetical protein Goarm_007083, partial [Gossypium armourianum]|nr:hypothetical protein [Gossypium armourianum]